MPGCRVAPADTTAMAVARVSPFECQAIKKRREELGRSSVVVMIPFCRTLDAADRTVQMVDNGLCRGDDGLERFCCLGDSIECDACGALRSLFE